MSVCWFYRNIWRVSGQTCMHLKSCMPPLLRPYKRERAMEQRKSTLSIYLQRFWRQGSNRADTFRWEPLVPICTAYTELMKEKDCFCLVFGLNLTLMLVHPLLSCFKGTLNVNRHRAQHEAFVRFEGSASKNAGRQTQKLDIHLTTSSWIRQAYSFYVFF